MGTGKLNAGDNPTVDLSIPFRGSTVEVLQVASCYKNQVKLRADGSLGSYSDFTFAYGKIIASHVTYYKVI